MSLSCLSLRSSWLQLVDAAGRASAWQIRHVLAAVLQFIRNRNV
jgi:hypothetical protein